MKKILNNLSIPFRNLKVFHQLLIIVILMTGFLALEGFLGVNAIDTMEQVTRKIFSKSMSGIAGTNEFANNSNRLQLSYISDLLNNTSYTKGLYTEIESTFTTDLAALEEDYPDESETLKQELATIKRIIWQPASRENYRRIEASLGNVRMAISAITNKMVNNSAESMHIGAQFSTSARVNTIVILIIGVLAATLIAFCINFFIARPLKKIKNSAKALAQGDLTKTIHAEGSIEVSNVIGSLNKAILALRDLVRGINEQASMIYSAGQELRSASNETGRSAVEVARAMEDLSRGSAEEANQITQVVAHINVLSDLVREVSTEMRDVSLNSENVARSAQLGQKAAADISREIIKLYDTTKEVTTAIVQLNEASVEIGEITMVIQNIAEQTGLLALNAAIEAARAGEHGKGFGVVATETGKLAEQSKQSALHISELISQMKTRTTYAVNTITSGMTIVESGKERATEATVTFERIFEGLEHILNRISKAAVSARRMGESNEQVIAAVTNIAALSEESMASTEEVSATAEEQSASVEEVSSLAENLAEIAKNLKKAVAVFEIK
jgi:methyl-accepting chemotaxis protein